MNYTVIIFIPTFMLFRQALLKSMLLLELTILMDELRITLTAECSFSWPLNVSHDKYTLSEMQVNIICIKYQYGDYFLQSVLTTKIIWND